MPVLKAKQLDSTWVVVGGVAGGPTTVPVPIAEGGTGSSSAAGARVTLQVQQADGQCQLRYESPTLLRLVGYDGVLAGGYLMIDGTARLVPAAGVTVSNAGLPATTLCGVYAYWTGSAVALEVSTVLPVEFWPGYWVKSGDQTRRVVGIVRTTVGTPGPFINTGQFRGVRSAFHPRDASLLGVIGGAVTQPWPVGGETRADMRIAWLTAEQGESRLVVLTGSALTPGGSPVSYLYYLLAVNGGAPFVSLSTAIQAAIGDYALTLPAVVDTVPWTWTTLDPLIAGDGTTTMTISARTRLWGTARI